MAARKGIKTLKDYFGYRQGEGLKEFAAEINELSDDDFYQLRDGIENESLTY